MLSNSLALVATFLFPLIAYVHSAPAGNSTESLFEVYHSVTGTTHADRAKSLSERGYHILSLSAYGGSSSDAQYSAVWVQREGGAQQIIQDADYATFSAWWQSWKAQGYIMTQVSATGPSDDAVFAAVVEENTDSTQWEVMCDLDSPWASSNATVGLNMIVKGFRMYGTADNRRYCILSHDNIGNQLSTIFYDTPSFPTNYDEIYESELKKRFWRPGQLYLSDNHVVTPAFVDTNVGSWVAYPILTTQELDAEIKSQAEKGLYPISLQGGGHADDVRFSVLFAENYVPEARQWTTRGYVQGFQDNAGAEERFDMVFKDWMERNGVRQAQLAVALNGTTITERSYTWAESDRVVVEPDDTFLLGSVTKMFTHDAVYDLVQKGLLNYSTPVFSFLGIKPTDERSDRITVQHVLEHKGGWDRTMSGDPAFSFTEIGMKLFQGTRAVTLGDFVEWMGGLTLDFEPGYYEAYSNIGTMLMGYLVANVTGLSYLDYLKENILDGLDVKLYQTDYKIHDNDRIVQESVYTGVDPRHPLSTTKVPGPHGGDGAIKEECVSAFALASSATSIAKFIGSHAVWGYGARQPGYTREGSVVGARAWAASRSDVDFSVVVNRRDFYAESDWLNLVDLKLPWVFENFPIEI